MEKLKYTYLDERKSDILRLVIEEYISENKPIASNYIKLKYNLPFSSATIRNIFAKLEELGFLQQTHTSSGRIPTDIGYRYYVDNFIDTKKLKLTFNKDIEEKLLSISSNVDELMQETVLMLSKLSGLFGVVMISGIRHSILTEIELISLASNKIMMVIALKSGMIKSLVLNLDIIVEPRDLDIVNRLLRERLIGKSIEDVQSSISELLRNSIVPKHEIIQIIFQHPLLVTQFARNNQIYTSSYKNLLEQPEFHDFDLFHKTISGIDQDYIKQILSAYSVDQNLITIIGNETENELLSHCSIVASEFESDFIKGKIGLLGPTRIPYKNVIKILKEFTEIMTNVC